MDIIKASNQFYGTLIKAQLTTTRKSLSQQRAIVKGQKLQKMLQAICNKHGLNFEILWLVHHHADERYYHTLVMPVRL